MLFTAGCTCIQTSLKAKSHKDSVWTGARSLQNVLKCSVITEHMEVEVGVKCCADKNSVSLPLHLCNDRKDLWLFLCCCLSVSWRGSGRGSPPAAPLLQRRSNGAAGGEPTQRNYLSLRFPEGSGDLAEASECSRLGLFKSPVGAPHLDWKTKDCAAPTFYIQICIYSYTTLMFSKEKLQPPPRNCQSCCGISFSLFSTFSPVYL